MPKELHVRNVRLSLSVRYVCMQFNGTFTRLVSIIIIFDPEKSQIAHTLELKTAHKYALKVS
jgi:RNA polymerase subunit RPABC4/transcription elongation factor Spt4